MSSRRDEIEEETRRLRSLERLLTDQRTLDGIKGLIADLEAEKADRYQDKAAPAGGLMLQQETAGTIPAVRSDAVRAIVPSSCG